LASNSSRLAASSAFAWRSFSASFFCAVIAAPWHLGGQHPARLPPDVERLFFEVQPGVSSFEYILVTCAEVFREFGREKIEYRAPDYIFRTIHAEAEPVCRIIQHVATLQVLEENVIRHVVDDAAQ
jgi:hypothetical protein